MIHPGQFRCYPPPPPLYRKLNPPTLTTSAKELPLVCSIPSISIGATANLMYIGHLSEIALQYLTLANSSWDIRSIVHIYCSYSGIKGGEGYKHKYGIDYILSGIVSRKVVKALGSEISLFISRRSCIYRSKTLSICTLVYSSRSASSRSASIACSVYLCRSLPEQSKFQ